MKDLIDAVTGVVIAIVGFVAAAFSSVYFVALVSRMAWHFRLVQKRERALIDSWLWFDFCVVLMAVVCGKAIAATAISLFNLAPVAFEPLMHGAVAALAYLGPEGVRAAFARYWFGGRG